LSIDLPVILAAGAILLAVLAAAGLVLWMSSRSEARMAATRQEMQVVLSAQVHALTTQLGQLTQAVNQQLGQVRQELQASVSSSVQLANNTQREISQQLQSSTEAVRQVSQQIGAILKASDDISHSTQTLQTVLGGARTRGALGEIALERLLEDALPRAAYETQFRFSTGNVVDAIVRHGDRILSIDSKFPLEAYRRLAEQGEEARRDFCQAVRKHTDSIAEKYILPNEQTLDLALMFVPSEGVYYELLMSVDPKHGRLDEYCRARKVLPVSPNTCYAYLCAIAMSYKGLRLEENARRLLGSLDGLKKQLESFADVYEKLGNHLRYATQNYEDADSKLGRARNALEQMAQGFPEVPTLIPLTAPSGASTNALEPAVKESEV
jgi:DNA recombination protein RmuC